MILTYIRTLNAVIVKEIVESWYYRSNFIMDLVIQGVLYVLIVLSGDQYQVAKQYNIANSSELVFLGYILWSYSVYAIATMANGIAIERQKGTLEHKFTSVSFPWFVLIGEAVGGILTSSVFIILLSIIIYFINPVVINFNFLMIPIAFLSILGMYGLGFILAGISIFMKKVGQLIFITQIALLFSTGALMPLNNLPSILKFFAETLPLTRGIDLLRKLATGMDVSYTQWLIFITNNILFFFIGIVIFHYFYRLARKKGILSLY